MMRIIGNIILFVLMIVAAAFAIINADLIQLNYFIGHIKVPLALVLIITFIAGALMAVLFNLSGMIRLKRENKRLQKKTVKHQQEQQHLLTSQDPKLP
ncbi:MAG: LapA family protein [Gammaproteobacteria bacterium]|nr:LapA family protein [Gammaproteobacteria bacterium]